MKIPKQKKILTYLLSVLLFCTLFPVSLHAESLVPYSSEWEEQLTQDLLNGEAEITYDLFGAKGDGITNDFEAIKRAHDFANNFLLEQKRPVTVYADPDKTYCIREGSGYISVITDVDWRGATLIFDDWTDNDRDGANDVITNIPVFDVVSDVCVATNGILFTEINKDDLRGTFSPETEDLSFLIDAVHSSDYYTRYKEVREVFDDSLTWGVWLQDNSKRWIRKGVNQNSGDSTAEVITFNSKSGELLSNIDFTYSDLKTIRVFPIRNDGIAIGNAYIQTRTNNDVYTSSSRNPYTGRGIRIRYTGNVILHDIVHTLDEKAHPNHSEFQGNPYGNLYSGIIDINQTAYVSLEHIDLSAHTPCPQYTNKSSYHGTYDIQAQNTVFLYLEEIGYANSYEQDILDPDRWGVIATNQGKETFLLDSTINRMDAHRGITDLYIEDTVFGQKGLTLIGQGDFYAEDIVFDQAVQILSLRQDYGASWDGDMYFKNVTANLPESVDFLIYAYNTQNWNFGSRSYFPNLYIDGLHLSSDCTASLVLLQTVDVTNNPSYFDTSDPDNLYYFKGDIQIKNITMDDIRVVDLFLYNVSEQIENLQKSYYGGNNTVTLDLDPSVNVNGDIDNSDPKFVRGNVQADYEGTKERLLDLYDLGRSNITGSYSPLPSMMLMADTEYIELGIGTSQKIGYSVLPQLVPQKVSFTSQDLNIASVDKNGTVTGIASGETIIDIETSDGLCQTSITVKVLEISRVYGSNRYRTSIQAADYLKTLTGADLFDSVVLTSGENFADALAGSYLANLNDAPILLINEKRASLIKNYIRSNLKENGTIYVLGGDSAVPEEWISDLYDTYQIDRVWGKNRYITDLEILKKAGFEGGRILVCVGKSERLDEEGNPVYDDNGNKIDDAYADSLSASAVDLPILLVDKNGLKKEQIEYLSSFSRNLQFIIIGGNNAVPEEVETSLQDYGTVLKRLAGSNRYETSKLIAEEFFMEDPPEKAVLAYGHNFPDGLSGGTVANHLRAPLLLARPKKKDRDFIISYTSSLNIREGVILGGNGLIDDETVGLIFAVLEHFIRDYEQ